MFGFSGCRLIDLVYFEGDAIPTLADEEGHAKGHAIIDNIVPQPTEMTHSPLSSPSVSSAETNKPLHPPASPSFHLPATIQPALQFAAPSKSAPSDTSPRIIAKSEGKTLQPAIFSDLFSLGNILDSVIQCYIDLAFR